MTQHPRRTFLRNTLATAVLVAAGGTGLFSPPRALAAEWPKDAFTAKKLDEAISALFGSSATSPSASIKLKAPAQAENSAQVQIQVTAELPDVEVIAILK